MAFKMKAGKKGPMMKNYSGVFKKEKKIIKKGDKEFEGIKAAKDKINKTAKSVNTPGAVVSGETFTEARKRVKDTKKAYQDPGKYSSEDRKRYKKMGLKPGKEMSNQKRKEKEASKNTSRKTGEGK